MKKYKRIFRESLSYGDAISYLQSLDSSFPGSDLTASVISAFRKKFAKKFHPDIGHSGDELKIINDALDTVASGDYSAGQSYSRYTRSSQRNQPKETPVWVMAGYSGGMKPQSSIFSNDYSDINYIKKKAWEMSGRKKNPSKRDEFTFDVFDGSFYRGGFTVYGVNKPAFLKEMAEALQVWSFHKPKAVIVGSIQYGKKNVLIIPIQSGKVSNKNSWFEMEHNSFNDNPGNDRNFLSDLTVRLGL